MQMLLTSMAVAHAKRQAVHDSRLSGARLPVGEDAGVEAVEAVVHNGAPGHCIDTVHNEHVNRLLRSGHKLVAGNHVATNNVPRRQTLAKVVSRMFLKRTESFSNVGLAGTAA